MSMKRRPDRSPDNIVRRAAIDALEPRRMLAVFNGTSGNDEIEITIQAGGAASIVAINGSVNVTSDTSITINGGVGDDLFRVFRVRNGTTILARGDAGNDTLVDVGTTLDLDAIFLGDLTFEGGTGTDSVIADNSGDTATTPYEIGIFSGGIRKFSSNTIFEYNTIERLDYRDNGLGNLINFRFLGGFGADIAATISGNGGNDTIFNADEVSASNGNWPADIGSGGMRVDGGAGTDTLLLSNNDFGITTEYLFINVQIDALVGGVNQGTITYPSCETVDVVSSGTNANDLVRLLFKFPDVALRFSGGPGDDSFIVAGGDVDNTGILLANTTLLGGAGTDSIVTDDRTDRDATGETEVYTWNATTLSKGAAGFTFSEFESQALIAANGINAGQFNSVPRVDLNATAVGMASTTVTGGNDRMCSVSVSTGSIGTINGTLFLNLGGGPLDTVNFNGQNTTGDVIYQLATTQLLLPRVVNYSGVNFFNINAGSGNDTFFISGVPAGMAVQLNAGLGNDSVTVANGNVDADLLGPVTFNGSTGANAATVNNTTDSSPESQTLNGTTFIDGLSHTFNNLSDLTINNGPGGTVLAVNSVSVPTTINGGSASDHFDVGNGDIDANIAPGTSTAPSLLIDGNGGIDSIRFNDMNDTVATNDLYLIQQIGFDQLNRVDTTSHVISWIDIEGVTLDQNNVPQFGNNISLTIVNLVQTPLRINGNGGPDSFEINDTSTPAFIHTGLGDRDRLSVNGDGDTFLATVIIEQDDDIENLTVGAGGTLRITSNAVVAKTRLGLNPSLNIAGVLDLAGGSFLSRAGGPTTAVWRDMITRGYNAGAWNGVNSPTAGAVNSSLAAASSLPDGVGFGLGSEIAPTTIGPFAIAPGDTLLTHALYGDSDLNGAVNLADFNRLASNFGLTGRDWATGDFNYDGTTSLVDFNALASNFGVAAASMTSLWQPPNPRASGHDDDDARGWLEQL